MGNRFIWEDSTLVQAIRKGGVTLLYDLDLAQQPVIEGINSLFDHRGSLYLAELNETIVKHPNFIPIAILKAGKV